MVPVLGRVMLDVVRLRLVVYNAQALFLAHFPIDAGVRVPLSVGN